MERARVKREPSVGPWSMRPRTRGRPASASGSRSAVVWVSQLEWNCRQVTAWFNLLIYFLGWSPSSPNCFSPLHIHINSHLYCSFLCFRSREEENRNRERKTFSCCVIYFMASMSLSFHIIKMKIVTSRGVKRIPNG